MKVESQKNVTNVPQIVSQTNDDHRDAGKVWYLAHVLNTQRINLPVTVLHVGRESICAFARQEFEVHREDADSRAIVSGVNPGRSERKRLGLHRHRFESYGPRRSRLTD
jgi:hypothetical protein